MTEDTPSSVQSHTEQITGQPDAGHIFSYVTCGLCGGAREVTGCKLIPGVIETRVRWACLDCRMDRLRKRRKGDAK